MAPQQEWLEKDYYKILGISPTATDKEITRAYRKLAKQHHPDANPGSEDRFKEISAAYSVISDKDQRKEYDEFRRLASTAPRSRMRSSPSSPSGTSFRLEDLGDIFGDLGSVFTRSSRPATYPRRGADLEAEISLSFEDAFKGITTSLRIASPSRCATCAGTGAAPGSKLSACTTCGGTGTLSDPQGMFQISHICPDCSGAGMKPEKACQTCKGTGESRTTRDVKIRIPPGVKDSQRIRIRSRGAPGNSGGPAGDLYVIVHVHPHKFFAISGNNLTLTIPITFPEAALGTTLKVPTMQQPVTLRIPPGTTPGKTFRVKGHGVHASAHTTGDLLVTVSMDVPKNLNASQRQATEALAKTLNPAPRDFLLTGSSS